MRRGRCKSREIREERSWIELKDEKGDSKNEK